MNNAYNIICNSSVFILIITYNRVINPCSSFLIIQSILWSTNLYLFCLQSIHNTFQYSVYEIQSWLIDALHIIIVTHWTTIRILHCASIYLKSDISSINNNYLLTNSTNTIGIYGQSIQILKNKIDTNYNTNDIELFDVILSAVYSNLRLHAYPRF
eukprot:449277_1